MTTPRSVVQLITQPIPRKSHPSTPPPPPPHTPSPTPPPPPPFNMENEMKISIFKGIGSEDPEQFWFIANAIWTTQQIIDDNIKKVQLVIALQDCTVT